MSQNKGYVGNGAAAVAPPSYPSDGKVPQQGYGFTAPHQSYGTSSVNPDVQTGNTQDKMGFGHGHGQQQSQGYGQGQGYNAVGNQGQATGHTGSGQPIYVVNQPQPQRDFISDIFLYFIAIFIPPAAVLVKRGCGAQFWINILLVILAFIPAIVHAFYIIAVTPTVSKPPRR